MDHDILRATSFDNLRAHDPKADRWMLEALRAALARQNEPAPILGVQDRTAPLAVFLRVVVSLLESPTAIGAAWPHVLALLQIHRDLIVTRARELATLTQRHAAEPAGVTGAFIRETVRSEFRLSAVHLRVVSNAIEDLETAGPHLAGILDGSTCPICLKAQPDGPRCATGWRALDPAEPQKLTECPNRQALAEREQPLTWETAR
jgi:hypothetical protein